jgi:hypothetical protein
MFFTLSELQHIATGLSVAISEQSNYEREKLHYTGDSAQVAAWKQLRDRIEGKPAEPRVKYPVGHALHE